MTKIVPAVKGIIIHKQRLLIVRRAAADFGGGTWECPGGKMDFGEFPLDSLVREIKEETQLTVSPERLLYASSFLTHPDRQIILLMYVCSTNQTDVQLSAEHDAHLWADESTIRQLIAPNILADFEQYDVFSLLQP
ncbi:NUDIX hydrolase [Exiguobacterium acetylicum]|uniref:NUDIX hydrolase n=1 Tax=Exiguobacterium acetylicum TaxID=41170 RepID=UPI001EE17A6C|nr:NUDIX domain-containing protein [Exiguobacterium acetylicum]UKS56394.1 NUDIX domain-containing protein [Exiguobacterium acetylicum]